MMTARVITTILREVRGRSIFVLGSHFWVYCGSGRERSIVVTPLAGVMRWGGRHGWCPWEQALELRCNRDHPQGAAGAVYDFEGGGDYDGACGGQFVEVDQAGDAEPAGAVHECVTGEGGIETACQPGIGADRLHADT